MNKTKFVPHSLLLVVNWPFNLDRKKMPSVLLQFDICFPKTIITLWENVQQKFPGLEEKMRLGIWHLKWCVWHINKRERPNKRNSQWAMGFHMLNCNKMYLYCSKVNSLPWERKAWVCLWPWVWERLHSLEAVWNQTEGWKSRLGWTRLWTSLVSCGSHFVSSATQESSVWSLHSFPPQSHISQFKRHHIMLKLSPKISILLEQIGIF